MFSGSSCLQGNTPKGEDPTGPQGNANDNKGPAEAAQMPAPALGQCRWCESTEIHCDAGLCKKCCHNTSCWVSHTYTSSEDEANQPKTDVDKTGVPADDDAIDVAAFRQELGRRNRAELVAREGPAAPPGAEAAPAEAAPVWVQVVSTTGAPLEPRRLEQWELLFERKKVEARFWATELEAAAAEVVTVVANLGVSGVQQTRARDRDDRITADASRRGCALQARVCAVQGRGGPGKGGGDQS